MQKTFFKRKDLRQEARRRGAVSRFFRRIGNGLKIAGLVGTLAFSGCTFESSGMLRPDAGRKDGRADIAAVDATKDARGDSGKEDLPKIPDKGLVETIADSQGDLTKDMSPDTVPQWWDTSWKYCRASTLTGNFPADYAHLVVLDPASPVSFKHSQANGDLSDLRFIEGTCNSANAGKTPLPVWVEKVDSTNGSRVWFKSQTANITTVAMYYGNAGAINIFSGDLTFDFFDDFSGTALDNAKWGSNFGTSLNIGTLTLYSSGTGKFAYARSMKTFGSGTATEANIKILKSTWSGPQEGLALRVNYNIQTTKTIFLLDDDGAIHYYIDDNGDKLYDIDNKIAATLNDKFHKWAIIRDGSQTEFRLDDTSILSASTGFTDPAYLKLGNYNVDNFSGTGTINVSYSWVRVRKYVSPEPSVSLGPEKTQ